MGPGAVPETGCRTLAPNCLPVSKRRDQRSRIATGSLPPASIGWQQLGN
jgi:hypothetical protein